MGVTVPNSSVPYERGCLPECGDAAMGHFKGAYQTRNRAMDNRFDLVVFCIQHERGGAWQTMKYAKKQRKHWININELLDGIGYTTY